MSIKYLLRYCVFLVMLVSSFPIYAKTGFYLNGNITNIKLDAGIVELNFTGKMSHHSGIRIEVNNVKIKFPFDNLICDSMTGKNATESEFKYCFIPKYKIILIRMPSAMLKFGFNLESIKSDDSKVEVYRDVR